MVKRCPGELGKEPTFGNIGMEQVTFPNWTALRNAVADSLPDPDLSSHLPYNARIPVRATTLVPSVLTLSMNTSSFPTLDCTLPIHPSLHLCSPQAQRLKNKRPSESSEVTARNWYLAVGGPDKMTRKQDNGMAHHCCY